MRDRVGPVRQTLGSVATALAEHKRVGQAGGSTGDVDRSSTSKVEITLDEGPAVRVPGPAGDGAVNDRQPAEGHNDCSTS